MLSLSEVALFSSLPADEAEALGRAAEIRLQRAGDILVRRGEAGRAVYALLSGGARVQDAAGGLSVLLGPGEVVGEMSIARGAPTSATVTVVKDSHVAVLPKAAFLDLVERDASVRNRLAELLVERLRGRAAERRRPECIFLGRPASWPRAGELSRTLLRGLRHYAPGSRGIEANGAAALEQIADELESWRAGPHAGCALVVETDTRSLERVSGLAREGDAVLAIDDGSDEADEGTRRISRWGLADYEIARVGAALTSEEYERWHFRLEDGELDAACGGDGWERARYPQIDHVVRWMTRRELGVALGAGAARGFAHLGVLRALESAGLPIDCLAGSSIGGIVALLYGFTGTAEGALRLAEETLGDNDKIRDVSWLPRASFLAGKKIRRNAERITAGKSFAELKRPAFVAATDLVRGERVVLEKGDIATALLATGSIPGALPPIHDGARLLVDGALVSRVPVDLLERRRCGLRLAVNVLPAPSEAGAEDVELADELRARFERLLGFRAVIGRSWEILGFWHGSADAAGADFLVEPCTNRGSGYDFSTIHEMVAAGEEAVGERLSALTRAVEELLAPGEG